VGAGAATVGEDTGHGVAARADGPPDKLTADEEAALRLHYEIRLQVRDNRDVFSLLIPKPCAVAAHYVACSSLSPYVSTPVSFSRDLHTG
jgi:hypothetical protein